VVTSSDKIIILSSVKMLSFVQQMLWGEDTRTNTQI